jgi:BirA family biotin operon repressor/biotin-[acetyl-CoA-carboxylase] ligase
LFAGIGVNINNKLPSNLNDTSISLKKILGRELNRSEFLAELLTEFEYIYNDFCNNGFEIFVEEYNRNIAYKNKVVVIDDGKVSGVNLGIDTNGKLIVKTKAGFEKIISGTLRLKK